jgi:hypothetical protein
MTSRPLPLLTFTVMLAASALAHAQTPPAPPPPADAGPRHPDFAAMRQEREARIAEHTRALHDALAIRPNQESAFQAFAASMHPPDGPAGPGRHGIGGRGDHVPLARLTTPERADEMLRRFDEHASRMREALERHATAAKALYAVLSPEQQKAMDALPELSGRGEQRGWGHEPHGAGAWKHDGAGAGQ